MKKEKNKKNTNVNTPLTYPMKQGVLSSDTRPMMQLLYAAPAPRPVSSSGLSLEQRAEGLYLTDGRLELCADWTTMLPRLKQSNLEHEILIKAVRLKNHEGPLYVLDATAGLGEDSLLLAAAGFYVDLFEYDPVISALLSDSLAKSTQNPTLASVTKYMRVHEKDSIEMMRRMAAEKCSEAEGMWSLHPDVILLDPMFPERNKSASIKKKFQLLQQLERPCENEEELLLAALVLHPRKIVIKRPAKGPFLANRKPDYSLSGKAVRYDCIVFA